MLKVIAVIVAVWAVIDSAPKVARWHANYQGCGQVFERCKPITGDGFVTTEPPPPGPIPPSGGGLYSGGDRLRR